MNRLKEVKYKVVPIPKSGHRDLHGGSKYPIDAVIEAYESNKGVGVEIELGGVDRGSIYAGVKRGIEKKLKVKIALDSHVHDDKVIVWITKIYSKNGGPSE